jgi:hypothetical protein
LSPILVRPVREQLEHDRVIRQLQRDLARRKIEVAINPGAEQNTGLGSSARKEFPDAVLFSTDKGRKVVGVIEVETGESVNYLEAMAQWAHYARLKAPFHLYVPIGSVDVARRLALDHQIPVAEIHTFHQVGDLIRFASVYRSGHAPKLHDETPSEGPVKVKPPAPAPVPKKATPEKPVPEKAVPAGKAVAATKPAMAAKSPAKPPVRPAKPVAKKSAAPARKSAGKPARVEAKAVGKPAKGAKGTARPAPRKAAGKKPAAKRK